MKTIHAGSAMGAGELNRQRFTYDPTRHYVRAEKDSNMWDGSTLDALLNETLSDGSDAYKVELDGALDSEQRRQVGNRNLVLLSCPKSYIEEKQKAAQEESYAQAAISTQKDHEIKHLESTELKFRGAPDKGA